MKVYQVWDHDPMDGSMGHDYIAAIYESKDDADAEVLRRNNAWADEWRKSAGEARMHETWCWRHARVNEINVISKKESD